MDIDLVGTRPSDLGPTAERRFLRLCTSDACIGSSEQVGAGNYVAPWTFNNDGREDVARASAMKELLKEGFPNWSLLSRDDYQKAL